MRSEEEKRDPADARIEPLTQADVARVSALAREIWLAHYPGIISVGQIEYMLAQRYDPRIITEELGRAGLWWDKLTVEDGIAGFASYFLTRSPATAQLDKLYVQARHRRRGYGRRLIAQACAIAREQGCSRLELAVNRQNRDAIAAYRSCGFEITASVVKDIGGGYVMDDYVMAKAVNA